ncbi:MAG: cell division protein FtsZ [Acidobacteria bacterium]|nr:cell division protein FtsZ [Acidobacteriota bacterium]
MAEDSMPVTRIKVIGIGGAGGNAVARMMMENSPPGVEYYVLNTDRQALLASPVPNKIAIGPKVTNGLGAGSDPAIGRQAALEDTERIIEILEGADMVFVAAGLGGGTGTGAAPVVASLAKELNALTVAVVTKPFRFEGPRRMQIAERGLAELAGTVDTVISIPNHRLLEIVPKGTSVTDAFRKADDELRQAVHGISDIITTPGLINRDFADIRAIMLGMGYAMMSTGTARGDNAAVVAAQQAISNPLLEDGGVRGARGVLINITASSDISIGEVDEACNLIWEAAENPEVHINYGMVVNEELGDEVRVSIIATGFDRPGTEPPRRVEVPRVAAPAASIRQPLVMKAPAAVAPDPVIAAPVEELPPPLPASVITEVSVEASAPVLPLPPPTPAPVMYEPESPRTLDPPAPRETAAAGNDLDTPAFMRRERRLFQ